jgi:hypothetical protein
MSADISTFYNSKNNPVFVPYVSKNISSKRISIKGGK